MLRLGEGSGSSVCCGNLSSQNDVGATPAKTYQEDKKYIFQGAANMTCIILLRGTELIIMI